MTDAWVRDAEIRATEEERYTMAKWSIDGPAKQHEYEDIDVEGIDRIFNPVDRPQHYGQGSIECIEYIEDFLTHEEYVGYLRGNVAKYLHRWKYKNGLEDLRKATWYLDRLTTLEENK
jgi:hypothetical protein